MGNGKTTLYVVGAAAASALGGFLESFFGGQPVEKTVQTFEKTDEYQLNLIILILIVILILLLIVYFIYLIIARCCRATTTNGENLYQITSRP
jgi:heme/copper-type cytochrome/quinol oxidase subunit 2